MPLIDKIMQLFKRLIADCKFKVDIKESKVCIINLLWACVRSQISSFMSFPYPL